MRILLIFLFSITMFSGQCQEMYKVDYSFTDNIGTVSTSSLYTNNKEAVYKIYDSRERGMVDLPDGKVTFVENDDLSKFYSANDTISYARFSIYNEEVAYSDLYKSKLKWKINVEKQKKIGDYNCTEAKVRINQRSFTAWFTFDVPLKFGPLKLHNLPGLIVEVAEDSGYLKIALTDIAKIKDLKEFNFYKNYFVKKKKLMNYKEYEQMVIDNEVAARIRVYTFNKRENLRQGSNMSITFDDKMFADDYLEYPSNLLNELNKVRP